MQRRTTAVRLLSYLYLGFYKLLVWVLLLLSHSTCLNILGPLDWIGFIDKGHQTMNVCVCLILEHLQGSCLDACASCAVASRYWIFRTCWSSLHWSILAGTGYSKHVPFSSLYTIGYILLYDFKMLVTLVHLPVYIVSLTLTWALILILSLLSPPSGPLASLQPPLELIIL